MVQRPSGLHRRLFALAGGSAALYLLAFTFPYWLPAHYLNVGVELYTFAAREPWRGLLFFVALAGLFGLYLAAYRAAGRGPGGGHAARGIWLSALVFCVLLVPVQPVTSSDVYGYVFLGRVTAVLGQNPFVHLARDLAADPYYFLVTFRGLPVTAGYGPLWVVLSAGLGWLARERLLLNLVLFKGMAAGLHLAGAACVYVTLRRLAPRHAAAGLLAYAWNPLLLYELVGNAHNDAAVAALALLGFVILAASRTTLAAAPAGTDRPPARPAWALLALPCFAAAALVKVVALLWLPLAAVWLLAQVPSWRARLRWGMAAAGMALLPLVAAYALFWEGMATLGGLLAQSNIYANSLPSLAIHALTAAWPAEQAWWVQGVKLVTALVFLPYYAGRLRAVWREAAGQRSWSSLLRASFDVMLFYLAFVGLQFWPWYLAWLWVPVALLGSGEAGDPIPGQDRWRWQAAVALCLAAPLLYTPFGWGWARAVLPPWTVSLLSALPLLGGGLWLARLAWQARRVRQGE